MDTLISLLSVLGVFLVGGGLVFLMASGFEEASNKRKAWNLWAAGLISDSELKRRIGEE